MAAGPLPLLGILIAQAGLSLRLVWSNTAFADEALYIWAGHMEWTHWLRGAPLPVFTTYFSGAPVVYPPLAAVADTIDGLAGARLLSMAFMLGATALLAAMTTRLYGRRAGLFAAAVFAGVCSTQFLGAFATYDAMAVFLLALSTWMVVRAAEVRPTAPRTILLVVAGLTVALADAAKYAAALFDPVVIAVAALACMMAGRRLKASLWAGIVVAVTLATSLLIALKIGGHEYLLGIESTTLTRSHGTVSPKQIIYDSMVWVGLAGLLALIGVAVSISRARRPADWLLSCVLAGAILLAPANQARIMVLTSLFKHVGFGAWFACAVAGLALSALADAVPRVKQRKALRVGVATVAILAVPGAALAGTHYSGWPKATTLMAQLRPILQQDRGRILATDGTQSVIEYYLPQDIFDDVFYGGYWFGMREADGKVVTQGLGYVYAVKHHFFSVIVLTLSAKSHYRTGQSAADAEVAKDIRADKDYRLAKIVPYKVHSFVAEFQIWVRK